jgi:hypothetical protein
MRQRAHQAGFRWFGKGYPHGSWRLHCAMDPGIRLCHTLRPIRVDLESGFSPRPPKFSCVFGLGITPATHPPCSYPPATGAPCARHGAVVQGIVAAWLRVAWPKEGAGRSSAVSRTTSCVLSCWAPSCWVLNVARVVRVFCGQTICEASVEREVSAPSTECPRCIKGTGPKDKKKGAKEPATRLTRGRGHGMQLAMRKCNQGMNARSCIASSSEAFPPRFGDVCATDWMPGKP